MRWGDSTRRYYRCKCRSMLTVVRRPAVFQCRTTLHFLECDYLPFSDYGFATIQVGNGTTILFSANIPSVGGQDGTVGFLGPTPRLPMIPTPSPTVFQTAETMRTPAIHSSMPLCRIPLPPWSSSASVWLAWSNSAANWFKALPVGQQFSKGSAPSAYQACESMNYSGKYVD